MFWELVVIHISGILKGSVRDIPVYTTTSQVTARQYKSSAIRRRILGVKPRTQEAKAVRVFAMKLSLRGISSKIVLILTLRCLTHS